MDPLPPPSVTPILDDVHTFSEAYLPFFKRKEKNMILKVRIIALGAIISFKIYYSEYVENPILFSIHMYKLQTTFFY